MTSSVTDPVERVANWFRAHEFPAVERVSLGSSVLVADNLRCRVWAAAPADQELLDLAEATPEQSWCAAVLSRDPDGALATGELAVTIAALVLDADGGLRAGNQRGRELVEWVGARQRARSFTQRALHVLEGERSAGLDATAGAAKEAEEEPQRALPIRETKGAGIHETPATPLLAARAALEDPEPEPTPDEVASADAERQRRIDDMRRQRELRKSVKHR